MLYTADNLPMPPTDVVAGLRAFDERFGLRYMPGMEGWAVTRKWRHDDTRREMIQRGEMSPDSDWDILTMVPRDCSLRDVVGYLMRLPKYRNDREIEALCDALLAENEAITQANMDQHTQGTDEWIEVRGHRLTDTPRVFNAGVPDAAPVAPVVAQAVTVPKKKGKKK